jgi:Ca-activated chloride channel homolog
MINIQTNLEKPGVYTGQKESQILLEITGQKKVSNKKRNKINLSLVIDVSGSMGGTVQTKMQQVPRLVKTPAQPQPWVNPNVPFQPHPWNPNPNPNGPWLGIHPNNNIFDKLGQYEDKWEMMQRPVSISKLDQAKDAARKAVQQMNNGDYVSIVIFDDTPRIVCPSVEISESSKQQVLNAINTIGLGGSTNLHGGWLLGATEVAKKMSNDFINRVVILTDGQTNAGIQNPAHIAKDVAGLYEKSISTTTFGIGEQFNEDLLQKMANAGGGNFYYIDDDTKLSKMFADEFDGLNNLCATEVKLSFEFKNDTAILENLNDYEKKGESYMIPNVQLNNKISALFKIKVKVGKAKNLNLGSVVLSYKDEDGLEQKLTMEVKVPVLSKEDWEALPSNEEIKVQETLLVIAKNKIAATHAIDIGNIAGARDLLTQSAFYASASGLSDSRLMAESASLDTTLLKAQNSSAEAFRKDLSYQSYQTRYSKDQK